MQDFGVSPFQKRSWGGDPPNFGVPPPYLLLIGPLESVTQTAQAGTQLLLRTRGSPREVTVGDSSPPAAPTLGGSLVVPILRRVKLTCGEVGGEVRLHPLLLLKAAGSAALPVLPAPGYGGGGGLVNRKAQNNSQRFLGGGGRGGGGVTGSCPLPPHVVPQNTSGEGKGVMPRLAACQNRTWQRTGPG